MDGRWDEDNWRVGSLVVVVLVVVVILDVRRRSERAIWRDLLFSAFFSCEGGLYFHLM